MNEDTLREQELYSYLEGQNYHLNSEDVVCPECEGSFEKGYDEANTIESEGACPDCLFNAMLQEKAERFPPRKTSPNLKESFTMTTATKEAKAPIVKVAYSDEPITSVPGPSSDADGFNPSRHLPLVEKDFASADIFYDWRAAKAQRTADGLRQKAEDIRKYGNLAERKAARTLEAMRSKMADFQAKLVEQLGADAVAELMANLED